MMKYLSFVAFFIFLTSFSHAYYADVTFVVAENGDVTVSGLTNVPEFSGVNSSWTSKRDSNWMLNLTFNYSFQSFVFTISLPTHATIQYLKSSRPVRIGAEGNSPVISLSGQNTLSPEFVVQYQIKKSKKSGIWLYLSLFAILALLVLVIIFRKSKEKIWFDISTLPERQKDIVQLLLRGFKTQKYIEEKLKIPKSSVSRNINSLVNKGIVKKTEKGMSNQLEINYDKPVPPGSG